MNYEYFFLKRARTRPKVFRVLAPSQYEAKLIVARRFGWIPQTNATVNKFLHSVQIRRTTVQLVTSASERGSRAE